jgi:hypothetical protein
MTRTSPFRTVILWFVISLLILFLAGALLFLAHPTLLTGGFYEFTVTSVEFGPQGHALITYEDVLSYGTSATWEYHVDKLSRGSHIHEWAQRPASFLRWPRKEKQSLGVFLATDEEREKGKSDSPSVRERLRLKAGTYRIRSGERMDYFRWTDPEGTVIRWQIEVSPHS